MTDKYKTPARVRLLCANTIGQVKIALTEDDLGCQIGALEDAEQSVRMAIDSLRGMTAPALRANFEEQRDAKWQADKPTEQPSKKS